MPLIDEDQVLGPIGQFPITPTPADPVFFGEVLPAAFRVENTIASIIESGHDNFEDVPGFDPFTEFDDRYVPFADSFIRANSPEEVSAIQGKIDRELEDREILQAAGFRGMVASFMAGGLDPLIFIPVGGAFAAGVKIGSGVLKTGAATAFAGFTGSSATEMALQTTQEIRTAGESALNIAAATFLSGVLGSGASALTTRQMNRLIKETEAILDPKGIAGGKGDEAIAFLTDDGTPVPNLPEGERLLEFKGTAGVDKALARVLSTPMTRVGVLSKSNTARQTMFELDEVPAITKANVRGEVATIDPAVASMVKLHTAGLGQAVQDMDTLFVQMKTGKKGSRGKRILLQVQDRLGRRDLEDVNDITYAEFKVEIARSMRRGDKHPIPEVELSAQLWRERVFEPLKNRAIEVGLLPKDVTVETALSYLMRVYNQERIVALRGTPNGLEVQSKIWLAQKHPELSVLQVEDIADQITNRILGLEGGRILIGPIQLSGSSPFKSRTFTIPDQWIENFLEDDIELIGRAYVRSMAPDVELQARFGSVDMNKQLKTIRDEYTAEIKRATTDKERTSLGKQMKRDLKDIAAMRDILRGTYARSGNPSDAFVRVNQGIRRFNLLRLGGGFMVSSLPDVGSVMMAHGLNRIVGDAFVPMIRNFKGFKQAAQATKETGTAWDMGLDTRALQFADLGDDYGRYSRFERALGSLAQNFSLVNLLSPWNAVMKQVAGALTQTRILRAVGKLRDGTISQADLEHLAFSRISKEDGLLIAEMFERHGVKDRGVWLANTKEWKSVSAEQQRLTAGATRLQKEAPGELVPAIRNSDTGEIRAGGLEHGDLISSDPDLEDIATLGRIADEDIGFWDVDADQFLSSRQASDRISQAQPVSSGARPRTVVAAGDDTAQELDAFRARTVFNTAVAKDVDLAIVTPGLSDRFLWMSTEGGKTIGQFKSFSVSATQRVFLLRLQQRDAAALNGLILSATLGSMVYAQKTLQAGRELSDDPAVWIREGVDRSGTTGFIFDMNNILEKATRNSIGVNALTGGPTASRYASRNITGALVGPSLGLVETLTKATGAVATGDFIQSDVRAIRRMVPYQNLYYFDRIVDRAEEAINREFRVPRTSQ